MVSYPMKIKNKPIETVRIRQDRAELLKAKAFEVSMQVGEIVSESDLVNFLIDTQTEHITSDGKELQIK